MESTSKSYNLWVIAVSILIICMYFPAMYHFLEQINVNDISLDDANQYVASFYKYLPHAIPTTYTDEYYLDALIPFGYKALYIIVAKYFDPLYFSRLLPFILFIITIAIIAFCVKHVSGTLASLCAVMLTLSFSGNIISSFGLAGGTPRAFAFPIVALVLLGLVQCRPYLLAILTIIATILYPSAAIIGGFSMSLMLLLPASYREPIADWSLKKRLFFIVITAFISVIFLMPQFLSAIEYGSRITPQTLGLFPEAGEKGINQLGDTLPFTYDINWLLSYFVVTFSSNGDYFSGLHHVEIFNNLKVALIGLIFFCLAIGLQQVVRKENAKIVRSLLLLVSGLFLFFLAVILQPYLFMPRRYFLFTIPIMVTVLFPIATKRLLNELQYISSKKGLSDKILVTFCIAIVFSFGGIGYTKKQPELSADEILYKEDFYESIRNISELDKNVLIAGFPNDKVLSSTKLYAQRNVLLTGLRHQAYHEKHTLEMRKRMNMFIKAYFATDIKDIITLSKEYGVTHMLVYKRHYENEMMRYIEPFKKDIKTISNAQKDIALLKDTKKLKEAAVFENNFYVLYDINKLIQLSQIKKYDK